MKKNCCPYCGHILEYEDMEVCPNCEKELPIDEIEETEKKEDIEKIEKITQGSDENKHFSSATILLILVSGFLLVLVFFLLLNFAFLSYGSDEPAMSGETTKASQQQVIVGNTTPSQKPKDDIYQCSIVGQWVRSGGADKYVFYPDGTSMVDIYGKRHSGKWIQLENSRLYQFSWDFGPGPGQPNYYDARVELSGDCDTFSLVNNYGNAVTAVRKNWM